jgi:protein O-mannosyl-transferase
MKNPEKKMKTSNRILLYAVIFMALPLCYAAYYFTAEDAFANNITKNVQATNITPTDSSLLTLQKALDLVKTNPGDETYINLSLEYFNNAMYVECIQAAQKALEYNASSYKAYNNMCAAYNKLGMWNKAVAAGQNAMAVIPGAQLAANNLQISIEGNVQLEKDITAAEALVKTSPTEENYTNLGYLYYQANKFDLSIAAYKKVIEINKNNVIAYNNICSAYNELGKWADAAVYCNKALAVDSAFVLSKNNLQIAKANIKK